MAGRAPAAARGQSARSSSLMAVFARVWASTFLTITAQASPYWPFFEGRVPGTTTEPAGTLLFEQWFPGTGASEALGMLVNTYDRIVPAGYITTNGTTAARIVLIHG